MVTCPPLQYSVGITSTILADGVAAVHECDEGKRFLDGSTTKSQRCTKITVNNTIRRIWMPEINSTCEGVYSLSNVPGGEKKNHPSLSIHF